MMQVKQERDFNDSKKFLDFLASKNPFSCDPTMRSIVTGAVADNAVNVHKSKEVGNKILSFMVGKNAYEYSFKKKDQAVTLGSKTVRINDDTACASGPAVVIPKIECDSYWGKI